MRNRLRFRRCSVIWISAFLLSSSPNTHGFLQWQAVWSSRMKNTRYDLCTANQLSDCSSRMKNTMYSYRTANHLSVLTSVRIGPLSFCILSLRPTFMSLKLVIVIPSQILLRIPQTRFRLSGSQECCPFGFSLYHEGSNLRTRSVDQKPKRYALKLSPNDYVELR